MTKTDDQKIEEAAEKHLSQFCIAPGTPHWIAGERDFEAGWIAGRKNPSPAVMGMYKALKDKLNQPDSRDLLFILVDSLKKFEAEMKGE